MFCLISFVAKLISNTDVLKVCRTTLKWDLLHVGALLVQEVSVLHILVASPFKVVPLLHEYVTADVKPVLDIMNDPLTGADND